jgi:HNH endonuclease
MVEQTAYPDRPLTDLDQRWFVTFVEAHGQRKPDGITGMCSSGYYAVASSREEALEVLRNDKTTEWGIWSFALDELQSGADVRICEFDLARRLVIEFDPEALDPEAFHYYAIILECSIGESVHIPTRCDAYRSRERASLAKDAVFQATSKVAGTMGDLPTEIRSLIKVRRGCWIWTGAQYYNVYPSLSGGYGRFRYDGGSWATHRLVYTLLRGKIPDNAILRHLCHRANCCNPDHLVPGTHFSNRMDEQLKVEVRKLFRRSGLSNDERLSQMRTLYGLGHP